MFYLALCSLLWQSLCIPQVLPANIKFLTNYSTNIHTKLHFSSLFFIHPFNPMLENQEMYHLILISDRDLAISSSKALTLSIIFSVDSLFFSFLKTESPMKREKFVYINTHLWCPWKLYLLNFRSEDKTVPNFWSKGQILWLKFNE